MKFLPLYISFDVIFREKSLIFFVEWGLVQWSAMAWRTKPSPFHVRQLRRLPDNRKTTCTIAMQIIFVKIQSFLPCYSATTLIVAMQKVYARDHIPERFIRWVEQWRFLSTLSKGWTFARGKSIDESLEGSLIDSIIPSVHLSVNTWWKSSSIWVSNAALLVIKIQSLQECQRTFRTSSCTVNERVEIL